MSCYRAFLLDKTNHVFWAKTLHCRDDASALSLGRKLRAKCHGIEVWDDGRFLGLARASTPDECRSQVNHDG
jgi:hypothetical protein